MVSIFHLILFHLYFQERNKSNLKVNPNAYDFYKIVGINPELFNEALLSESISKKFYEYQKSNEFPEQSSQNKLITNAFNVLNNSKLRRIYDLFGKTGLTEFWNNHSNYTQLQHLFASHENPITFTWGIPLRDFFMGQSHSFFFRRRIPCRCFDGTLWCSKCLGKSTYVDEHIFNLTIEKGSPDDQEIQFDEIGDNTPYHIPKSVKVHIVSQPDGNIVRENQNDLRISIHVSPYEKDNGIMRNITLPDGSIVTIISETGYAPLTYYDKGIPGYHGGPRGKLIVYFITDI